MGLNDFNLEKKYKIDLNAPKPVEWEIYEKKILKEYKDLLNNTENTEIKFQEFFERNPSMLPGAFGLFGESGHMPFKSALITQPKLSGINTKIPDFMWIAHDSCTVYPIFIEIERPTKKWFVTNGQQSADFTQAQNQLTDWKVWFSDINQQALFFKSYNISDEFLEGKRIMPYYILIYGKREEFKNRADLNIKRSQLQRENEVYMTFDRLKPNFKARDVITCYVENRSYHAKYIQEVFRLGPVIAEELDEIKDIKVAIKNNNIISKERKKFLLSRVEYWKEFAMHGTCSLICTSDWE